MQNPRVIHQKEENNRHLDRLSGAAGWSLPLYGNYGHFMIGRTSAGLNPFTGERVARAELLPARPDNGPISRAPFTNSATGDVVFALGITATTIASLYIGLNDFNLASGGLTFIFGSAASLVIGFSIPEKSSSINELSQKQLPLSLNSIERSSLNNKFSKQIESGKVNAYLNRCSEKQRIDLFDFVHSIFLTTPRTNTLDKSDVSNINSLLDKTLILLNGYKKRIIDDKDMNQSLEFLGKFEEIVSAIENDGHDLDRGQKKTLTP